MSDPLPDDVAAPVQNTVPEQSYPLLRRFLVLVLPILTLALAGLLVAAVLALTTIVERVYEAEASRRHASMVALIAAETPGALAAIAAGRDPAPADAARMEDVLGGRARDLGLACVAILSRNGTSLVGDGPACPMLDAEMRKDIEARVTLDLATPDATLFAAVDDPLPAWLVASVAPSAAGPVVVASLQESDSLYEVIGASTAAWVGGLALALVAAIGIALVLVVRTQRRIDAHSAALHSAREAIARFVSRHVRASALGGARARRCEATVLFMDIRDFSGFADAATPDETARLVATIAEIGFAAVLAHGGDVDRLLGDGLVARFDGADRTAHAFAAAEQILARMRDAQAARSVGIGLTDGDVVEATIAAGDRADATILGRTVNLCARLCAAARAGEIVAAATMPVPSTAALADAGVEQLTLKGHRDAFRVRRYRLAPA